MLSVNYVIEAKRLTGRDQSTQAQRTIARALNERERERMRETGNGNGSVWLI